MRETQKNENLHEESDKLRKLISLDIARMDGIFDRLKENFEKFNKIENILNKQS